MERFLFNAYVNAYGRAELNLNSSHHLGEKWKTALMGHASGIFLENDYNNDGFLDMPIARDYSLFNRWDYRGKNMEIQFGGHLYSANHDGGQFNKASSLPLYEVDRASKNLDLFAKTGFFFKKINRSLGVVYNYKIHQSQNQFGHRDFSGNEERGYLNVIYDDCIGNKDHAIKTGLSFVYSDITQSLDTSLSMIQYVPGVFFEYTFSSARMNLILGSRYDYHNLYSSQFSPRAHLKFILSEYTDLRLTGGKAWRVPNMIIDNISLLANSKTWVYPDTIIPEISWNGGFSIIQRFKFFKRNASITLDYYHTRFENQLIADRDVNIDLIVFKNIKGRSYSNAVQVELAISPLKNLDLRFAYKLLDVKSEFDGELQQRVMLPKHRGFMNFAYSTRNKRWEFDLTPIIIGSTRLPAMGWGGEKDIYSPTFLRLNGQITYKFKSFDLYLGGENITNYRQENPIIDAQNPFGPNFDATMTWGPIVGTNIYLGIRIEIERNEEDE